MKPYRDKPILVQIVHSFRYAFVGLRILSRDRNMLIHALASAVAIALGIYYRICALEWIALVLTMMLVTCLEAMNAAIEFAVDLASPEFHPIAAKAKDVASASVLIGAIGALVIGAIIFVPKVM